MCVGGTRFYRNIWAKWIYIGGTPVDVLIYVCSLADIDLLCYDEDSNRLDESLNVFERLLERKVATQFYLFPDRLVARNVCSHLLCVHEAGFVRGEAFHHPKPA